jgi:hypothetical protein
MKARRNKKRHNKKLSLLVLVVLAGIFASAAYAFTAAVNLPTMAAGDGTAAVDCASAQTTRPAYTVDNANPAAITSVLLTFDLTGGCKAPPTNTIMKLALVSGAPPTYYSCTNATATTWTCAVSPALSLVSVNTFRLQLT